MSEVMFVKISEIKVPPNRFRQYFSDKNLGDLQDSISSGMGLINAITLKHNMEISTGESRLKAITLLHDIGQPVFYHGERVPEGCIPALVISSSLEELDYLQAELQENTCRENFSFIEEAQAVAKIAAIKQAMIDATKVKEKPVFVLGVPLKKISKEAIQETAKQVYEGKSGEYYDQSVKDSLKIVTFMESNPDKAQQILKAKDKKEAVSIMRRAEESDTRSRLALAQGKSFNSSIHTVINGDCLEELAKLPAKSFDVCLTDPIYGINAGNFGNAAGKMENLSHNYDDSPENFRAILKPALQLVSKVLKDRAHIYLACDIRNYFTLCEFLTASNMPGNPWKITNAPFIQYKLAGGRIPRPGFTPRRSYELWLYAYRGEKQEYKCINDVIECVSDKTETHGAGKPKDLLKTFLSRSCMPGDTVLDFMAGTGSILPAAHELKIKATAIEISQEYYGRCLERLKELK
jgi:DNA modification methylase/ParB-like chromosome segregation protein Spo0J